MVEAIEEIRRNKEDQRTNFEKDTELAGVQSVQNNMPADTVETSVKPPSTSVSDTMESLNIGDSRSRSLENTIESVSGRLVVTSTTDPKRNASEIDQQQTSQKNADPVRVMDSDNDRLEDSLDWNLKNREEISREIADQNIRSTKRSIVGSVNNRQSAGAISSVKRTVDAINSGLADRKKQQGPGDIDVFEYKNKDDKDRIRGIPERK
jgi:hypothetical protein